MLTPSRNPKIDEIVSDVFGFSRGVTAARSFIHQLKRNFCDVDGMFCGVPMRIRFVGLFDTVASVGLADSVPAPGVEGHQDWGDESLLTIPAEVEQCVHMVAAHEARKSFSVDSVRRASGGYRDRAETRCYMSPKLAKWYEAEFNPSVALAELKACNECEEFSVTITRMRHELREDDVFGRNDYATNISYIEFVTVPSAPQDAEPRSMAVKLLWRPTLFTAKGDVPLEIDLEEMLVRRTRVSM